MFTMKNLLCLVLLSSMITACGEGSIESNLFGSKCYLNDNGDNQPILNTFNGEIVAGGVASLNLGGCVDVESGLTISSARIDDESLFTIETTDDEIQLTSLNAGATILTVSREGEEDVSFNIEALEANQTIPNEFGVTAALVKGTRFTSSLQFFVDDIFLAGGKYLMTNRVGSDGVSIDQTTPTTITLGANELGSHTINLESTELTVEVIEQSEAIISTMTLLGDSQPLNFNNVVLINFTSPSGLDVKSIGELTTPNVTSSDESICLPSFNENSLQTIFVEGLSTGTCELTISFDQFSTTHTLTFTEAVEETPADQENGQVLDESAE